MATEMIRIERQDGEWAYRRVVARHGVWVVHRTAEKCGDGYNVTHEPTGYAAIFNLPLAVALRALRDFAAIPGDWTFTDAKQLSKRQAKAGRQIKRKYLRATPGDEGTEAP